jgi:transposase
VVLKIGSTSLTIAELYRERWNVELFFKWIKHHLHIKSFYATSANAVYTQIWIAVCAFLLLALGKKKMHIEKPLLYMISQTIETMLFEKIPVRELFNKPNLNVSSDDGQLELFRDLEP